MPPAGSRLHPGTGEDADFLEELYRPTWEDLLRLGLPPALLDNMMQDAIHRATQRLSQPVPFL